MSEALIPNNVLFSSLTQLSVSPDTGNALIKRDNGFYVPVMFKTDLMIGAVLPFASKNIKDGWLPCNGQEISRNQYPKLFEMIGIMYGTPSNDTLFKLPDLNGNQYFIRGGEEVGKEQLGTPQTIDGYDHGSAHGFGLWYTSQMKARYGKLIPMKELSDTEKFGDNIYALGEDKFREYKDFLKHLWNGGDTGSGGVEPGTLAHMTGHMAMVSRPKNMTLYYCIYAGMN